MKDRHQFLNDIFFPDMLYALTVRSSVAKGELIDIVCPNIPDSYYLITAENTSFNNELINFNIPILAKKELSYIGQPVAIIAGPEENVLMDIANSIFLDTTDAEGHFSLENFTEDDVLVKRELKLNYENQEIEEYNRVIPASYFTGIQEHWYPEPCGAIAYYDDQKITICTATQWPYHVKRSVAKLLGLNPSNVKVELTNLAVPLDGKLWYPSLLAAHAALAAKVSGRPVKLLLSREEDFLYSPKRYSSEIKIKSSLDANNKLKDTSIEIKLNMGSSGVFKEELIDSCCLGSLGFYQHESFNINALGIGTNIPVQGPMTGFGLSQGFFAAECHASRIADFLGQNPAEWRKASIITSNSLAIGSQLKSNLNFINLIDKAASMSDYYRKWASCDILRKRRRLEKVFAKRENYRGIGISIAYQGSNFLHSDESGNGNCTAELTLEKDGTLKIKNSFTSSSSGVQEAWKTIANEVLGVEKDLIEVSCDNEDIQDSGAATLSRNMVVMSGLIERCCNSIRSQRFRDPLPITVRHSSKVSKKSGWQNTKINLDAFSRPGSACCVVEIEIDTDSFTPYIRGIWMAADGGRIYSLDKARTALETGIIQSLGWTIREQIHYAQGEIPLDLLRCYDVPSPLDIPAIEVEFAESEDPFPKGIGELPFNCIPAAYVQALSQALDYHFGKIPLDANDIYNAVKLRLEDNIL